MLSGSSIATTQPPQQPAVVFVRAVVGSRREAGGHFHTSSENLTTRFARGCFVITSCRLARRTTTQRYCGYHAFEHNGAAGKGYGVAEYDRVHGHHPVPVQVQSHAYDHPDRQRTVLERPIEGRQALDP